MEFDKEILRILMEAGTEGLSLQKVARHVFNAFNSFFNQLFSSELDFNQSIGAVPQMDDSITFQALAVAVMIYFAF